MAFDFEPCRWEAACEKSRRLHNWVVPNPRESVLIVRRIPAGLAIACICLGAQVRAQSAQPHSLQASLLATTIRINDVRANGLGFEGQFRFNRVKDMEHGVVSVGIGGQFSTHDFPAAQFQITGLFLEPRFAFPGERLFPYLAARLAVLRQSSDITKGSFGGAAGGGAGFAYVLTPRVNLDVGAALLIQTFANTTLTGSSQPYKFDSVLGYAAKAGFNFGF